MKNINWKGIIASLFLVFILWVIYMANTNTPLFLIRWVKFVPLGDKIGHFILFGILTLLLNLALNFRGFSFLKLKMMSGTLFVILFVIVEELSQMYLIYRTFDLLDLLAGGFGILVFHFLSKYFQLKNKSLNKVS